EINGDGTESTDPYSDTPTARCDSPTRRQSCRRKSTCDHRRTGGTARGVAAHRSALPPRAGGDRQRVRRPGERVAAVAPDRQLRTTVTARPPKGPGRWHWRRRGRPVPPTKNDSNGPVPEGTGPLAVSL